MEAYLRDDEIELLLNDILSAHGYDFTNYSRASLKRRLNRLFSVDRTPGFAEFRYRLLTDKEYFKRAIEHVTVNVTEMFRDPLFYKALRDRVIPTLGTYPLIRIWHAGCSTGEEVYSIAILLKEANLLHKSLLYATDLSPLVLEKADSGIFPLNMMKQYSENYILSGGRKDFSDYYTANYDRARFNDTLRSRMVFATHNLVSDRSFNEFQLIICRNVLIYFDKDLQNRVFSLFDESLQSLGYLALGSKETLKFSSISKKFAAVAQKEKIWRKIG